MPSGYQTVTNARRPKPPQGGGSGGQTTQRFTDGLSVDAKQRTLWVSFSPSSMSELQLIQTFKVHGDLKNVNYLWHRSGEKKGLAKGCAFVEYAKEDDAQAALAHLNGRIIGGRPITVRIAMNLTAEEEGDDAKEQKPDVSKSALDRAKDLVHSLRQDTVGNRPSSTGVRSTYELPSSTKGRTVQMQGIINDGNGRVGGSGNSGDMLESKVKVATIMDKIQQLKATHGVSDDEDEDDEDENGDMKKTKGGRYADERERRVSSPHTRRDDFRDRESYRDSRNGRDYSKQRHGDVSHRDRGYGEGGGQGYRRGDYRGDGYGRDEQKERRRAREDGRGEIRRDRSRSRSTDRYRDRERDRDGYRSSGFRRNYDDQRDRYRDRDREREREREREGGREKEGEGERGIDRARDRTGKSSYSTGGYEERAKGSDRYTDHNRDDRSSGSSKHKDLIDEKSRQEKT